MGAFWRESCYRLRQGLQALGAKPGLETENLVEAYLRPQERALLALLSPRDQYHSGRTASILIAAGVRDRELLVAALLHDIGKGRQALWQRAAYVIVAGLSPRLLEQLSGSGEGWRGALARSQCHARLGAELAAAAGCSGRVVTLIAGHHAAPQDRDQRRLQEADRQA